MPGPVSSADLDRSSDLSPEPRPHRGRHLPGYSSGDVRHRPGPPGPTTEPQLHQRRPRPRSRSRSKPGPRPGPAGPDGRRTGAPSSPSSTCSSSTGSCSTRRSNPDLAARPAARTSSDGEDRAEEGAQRALVPLPRPRRRRRLSSSDASVASGPDEYTVYPDGRISYEREDRPPYRRSRHPRPRPRPRPRRAWRRGARGEPYDDWEDPDPYWGRDRYRGDGKEDVDREKRRRRAREEGKGLLIAALVFLAGLILCSD
ncbi:hypothetical protein L209DRAFT_749577 [Thermothelomyces heterothallicus CBS 203.75]